VKRGAPLRRTGFSRKAPGPRHIADVLDDAVRAIPRPTRWLAGAPVQPREPVVTPKHDYVRCEAILIACRSLACQHCGTNDGTVVAAHANWGFGKGMGIKADDSRVAALCFGCHSELDQGKRWSEETRRFVWAHAHAKTVALLVLRGAWPRGVPVPETAEILERWG